MTDDQIRVAWGAAGGRFHGPNVETATIPEDFLFQFVRRLITEDREACAKVCDETEAKCTSFGPISYGARACAISIRALSSNAKLNGAPERTNEV